MVIVQTLFVPREPSPPRTLNQRYTHIDVSTQRPPVSNGYFQDHRLPLNHDFSQDLTATSGADRDGYKKREVIFRQELRHFISMTLAPAVNTQAVHCILLATKLTLLGSGIGRYMLPDATAHVLFLRLLC